ncbi:hypothetical protein GCM10009785_09730 [Brooklawnia cerclae]|uniref:Sucrose-6-phosphate hydrolase SacC (GH32 family) n=1 Tax=Brooklawnia cerclae TaxID=349934 RepID=A0ABX0SI68_9ACTN|nr:GH32 C-terminal domain-containing protein [Brooklawnia cerclae]NIH58099.1 sucrose-6-phosphate hydrolase SacC (GH32 family) [Brooklawnia cerclae]
MDAAERTPVFHFGAATGAALEPGDAWYGERAWHVVPTGHGSPGWSGARTPDLLTWSADAPTSSPPDAARSDTRRPTCGDWTIVDLLRVPDVDSDELFWLQLAEPTPGRSPVPGLTGYRFGRLEDGEFVPEGDPGFHPLDMWLAFRHARPLQNSPAGHRGRPRLLVIGSLWPSDPPRSHAWPGMLSLPRVLQVAHEEGGRVLRQQVPDEIGEQLGDEDSLPVPPAGRDEELPITDPIGLVHLRVTEADFTLTLDGVSVSRIGDELIAHRPGDHMLAAHTARFPLLPGTLELDLWVDRCSVELFADQGRECLSLLRVPPTGPVPWRLRVATPASAQITYRPLLHGNAR